MKMLERAKDLLMLFVWTGIQGLVRCIHSLLFSKIKIDDVKRILIFRTGQLGDSVVALPAVNHIRSVFPFAHISMLIDYHVNSQFVLSRSIFSLTGSVDDFKLFEPNKIRNWSYQKQIAHSISNDNYDLVFCLGVRRQTTIQLLRNMLWWRLLAGIRHANGFAKTHLIGSLEERFIRCFPPMKETDRLLKNILYGSARLPQAKNPNFGINVCSTNLTNRVQELVGPYTVCAVAPGSNMPVKQWGFDKYRMLGEKLLRLHRNIFLLVFGGPQDASMGNDLVQFWQERCLNLAGKTTISESYFLLRHADAFVGNDSGTMHLAAAVGVPCVAIFTARAPENVWYPYGENHRVIRHETECHYCMLKECKIESSRCIRSIDVDEVLDALQQILDKKGEYTVSPGLSYAVES
jgi:ADP-heptose:LPS heptosyltransferase